jgi:hypothetical protein
VGRASLSLLLAILACVWLAPRAQAAQTARLQVALTPEHLGKGSTIVFGFEIATSTGGVPSPLTELNLSYPANLGLATSGLGLATCSIAELEEDGVGSCPPNSQMGYGSAVIEVPIGPSILRERGTITTFMAPLRNGNLGLLFYAAAESPISAQLFFSGLVLPAALPFGGRLNVMVPLIPSLPEAPYAAVVSLRSTIGPLHLTYYERVHGKTLAYQPNGISLPAHCPRGGFPFAATFKFADGTGASAHASVPCPGHR